MKEDWRAQPHGARIGKKDADSERSLHVTILLTFQIANVSLHFSSSMIDRSSSSLDRCNMNQSSTHTVSNLNPFMQISFKTMRAPAVITFIAKSA